MCPAYHQLQRARVLSEDEPAATGAGEGLGTLDDGVVRTVAPRVREPDLHPATRKSREPLGRASYCADGRRWGYSLQTHPTGPITERGDERLAATTWTTKVDPAQIAAVGGQIVTAASPVQEVVGGLQGVNVEAPGFNTPDALNAVCASWAGSLTQPASSLSSIGAKIQGCSSVYAEHESNLGRSFQS